MNRSPHSRRRRSLETLEDRRLLAAFETPWPNARNLTVSFPADGATVDGQVSTLHETLDAVAERSQWQELTLRAFQTWAYYADINIGLRNDHGDDFGAPGLLVGDPRFGEFRFGAIPQSGALANSLPFQALAGTYGGDVLLNSDIDLTYHSWDDDDDDEAPVQTHGQNDPSYDLYSLLLHETGNALGIPDNELPWTVMFGQYTTPKGALSTHDLNAMIDLYGARSDPYETTTNDAYFLSTLVNEPYGFDVEEDVMRLRGSLHDLHDVDWYRFYPRSDAGSLRISVEASGISLLKSTMEVYSAQGHLIGTASADSVFENDIHADVDIGESPGPVYIRITNADGDIYSVGDYEVVFDYRPAQQHTGDLPRARFDEGIESLWTHFGLADTEIGQNDTVADAIDLPAALATNVDRYEVVSGLAGGGPLDGPPDVDVFRVRAPDQIHGSMVVHLSAVGDDTPELNLRILDSQGQPVGAHGRMSDDGTWTLHVNQPVAGSDYFIQISVDPSSPVDVGNYVTTVEFTPSPAVMHQMASQEISSEIDYFLRWKINESKLYRFDLAAAGVSADDWVKLTIYDAVTHEVKMVLGSTSHSTRSAMTMLDEGDYIFRFSAASRVGLPVDSIHFNLLAYGLSDDQDPGGGDEDETDPDYDPYYYYGHEGGEYYYSYYDPFYEYD